MLEYIWFCGKLDGFQLNEGIDDPISWNLMKNGEYPTTSVYKRNFWVPPSRAWKDSLQSLDAFNGQILCLVGHPEYNLDSISSWEKLLEQLWSLPTLQSNVREVGPPFLQLSLLWKGLGYGEALAWYFLHPNSFVDGGPLSQSLEGYNVL
jgi:hypothetical protein